MIHNNYEYRLWKHDSDKNENYEKNTDNDDEIILIDHHRQLSLLN
jgi:hypothetical protein